ncbi:uncharacterized protein BCR38DRAFT_407026 [Pseudomassariella vexata]|uniref:Uncharacterized protein n=1 Tax=Pseudomassariella vexata TaxID=1141098 RepID=A0A1Y2E6U7_9PEZI|nr:uncharacterized protein BCR38DRAFT_407026 [Pseudomassariella vexata]ORY67006.1 hypothetical protein BCR38DRAFT_407026 [Pseudomassariella vexata]
MPSGMWGDAKDLAAMLADEGGDSGVEDVYAHTRATHIAVVVACYRLVEAFLTGEKSLRSHFGQVGSQKDRTPQGVPEWLRPRPGEMATLPESALEGNLTLY